MKGSFDKGMTGPPLSGSNPMPDLSAGRECAAEATVDSIGSRTRIAGADSPPNDPRLATEDPVKGAAESPRGNTPDSGLATTCVAELAETGLAVELAELAAVRCRR